MAEYKTKHAIGDIIYFATPYDVDRDVISAVQIDIKGKVQYGVKRGGTSLFSIYSLYQSNDPYRWYSESEIFTDKKSAKEKHANLKSAKDLKEAKAEEKRKAEKRARLEKELKDLK